MPKRNVMGTSPKKAMNHEGGPTLPLELVGLHFSLWNQPENMLTFTIVLIRNLEEERAVSATLHLMR